MTAKEYLELDESGVYTDIDIIKAMQEYTKLKCKELLEIVSEKAKIEKSVNFGWGRVNIDSILNAVDLETFCS